MGYEIDCRNENEASVKRVVWATDLHFDAADRMQYQLFIDLVNAQDPDLILIGGDTSNGVSSMTYLASLAQSINKPIYFVLGNHDFYYGSIDKIREQATKLTAVSPKLFYLVTSEVIPLSDQTALIGHDGWADGRAGDFMHSDVMLNDYFLIEEFKRLNQEERLDKLNRLGTESAVFLKQQLLQAFENYKKVIVLTHVPPFEKSCLYKGKIVDSNWAPHFVSKAVGETLQKIMEEHPDNNLLVLCGHTHWGQDVQILPNMRVITGHSELGIPSIQGIIFVN